MDSELIGQKLIQLCIGEFQLQLNFESKISLAIECPIKSNGRELRPVDLMDLVGSRIIAVAGVVGEKLLISFDAGLEMEIGGRSDRHYESYQLCIGKDLYVGY